MTAMPETAMPETALIAAPGATGYGCGKQGAGSPQT
jgi:hypothetical protein